VLTCGEATGGISGAGSFSLAETKVVLSWLAAFHAAFWEAPLPQGLWEQGTYWYLDTRCRSLLSIFRDFTR
jgi:hypothetical protein